MTSWPTLHDHLRQRPAALRKGPLAIILVEDDAAVTETLAHHARLGFHHILALSPERVALPDELGARVTNLRFESRSPQAHLEAINAVIRAVSPGTWVYYGYNAEFLFFPFSETRSIGELLAFQSEERRNAMLTYVVDLYAPDLARHPDAVSLEEAMFDRSGYFALERAGTDGNRQDRQLDFYGGLRWRYEEHVPLSRRRIDRVSLFRTAPGLVAQEGHLFNDQEYNTYSCPWHHNLTAAVLSFRAAKALATNPTSREAIHDFRWGNSVHCEWHSQQLLELGLIEPGQWF